MHSTKKVVQERLGEGGETERDKNLGIFVVFSISIHK